MGNGNVVSDRQAHGNSGTNVREGEWAWKTKSAQKVRDHEATHSGYSSNYSFVPWCSQAAEAASWPLDAPAPLGTHDHSEHLQDAAEAGDSVATLDSKG